MAPAFTVILSAAGGQFASGVSLVEVYATVSDSKGQPVTGLTAADFRLEDDGTPQEVRAFASGSFPLAVAVAVDRSFSMKSDRLKPVTGAVSRLLGELRPEDEAMILAVGSEVEVVAPLATDRAVSRAAVNALEPWGTTPLYDAALAAASAIQAAKGRRALILISDGVDRFSRTSAAELLERVRQMDVLIYPIALGRRRPPVFSELASITGGRSFHVRDIHTLPATLSTITRELRAQYLLGYAPTDARPGWHSIRATVSKPGHRVRARDGYRSP